MTRNIPNLLTLANLATGFISLAFIINGDIHTASLLIVLSMLFDFADGLAARILNAGSEIGKQLDSLADIVSFGIVPGIMMYTLKHSLSDGSFYGTAMSIIFPALIPLCGALRLARFNIDPDQKESFSGLPIPAAAMAVAALVIASGHSTTVAAIATSSGALSLYSLVTALLMVSPMRLLSFKFNQRGIKHKLPLITIIVITAILFIILGIKAIILVIPLYIIISGISGLFRR